MTQLQARRGTPAPRPANPEPGGLTLAAARFFAARLAASWVPGYLAGRGFGEQALRPWTVGYAPAGWRALTAHLRDLGYADAAIQAAGLARRTRRGALVDFFRDRAMFGIRWPDGTLAGFTGRARPGGGRPGPVYLNSRTTGLYRKGSLLFGLYEGRRALAAGARPVLVEGPLDAIAVSAAGPYAGVSPCGTALTPAQVALLARTCDLRRAGVVVAFDADRAGRRAAVRAYHLLRGVTDHRRRRSSFRPARTRPDSGASTAAGRWPGGSTPACPSPTWWSTRRWRRSNAGSHSPTASSPRCTPPPRWSPGCRPARSRGRSPGSPAGSG